MRKTENINLNLYDPSDMFNITGGGNSLNKNMEIIDKLINDLQHRVVKKTASDTSVALEENTVFVFPEMATLTIIGENGTFKFTSGATATVLTLPDSVISDLAVEPNRIYEVSIVDGYLAWISWAVS